MGERFTNTIQRGLAIHSEALTGDPEGFGDRTLPVPTQVRLKGVDASGTEASRVSVDDIVRDDPLGYAEAHPATASVIDKQH